METLTSLRLSKKVLLVSGILIIAALLIFTAEFKNYFSPTVKRMRSILDPLSVCSPAITYSIESIDPRFGLSKDEFVDMAETAQIASHYPLRTRRNCIRFAE